MEQQPVIAFITGLSGTGKSTLVREFRLEPISSWSVYDFDKGEFECPKEPDKQHE